MNAEKGYSFDKVTMTTVVSVYRLSQAKFISCGMTVSVVVQAKLFSVSISVQTQLFFVWSGNTNFIFCADKAVFSFSFSCFNFSK